MNEGILNSFVISGYHDTVLSSVAYHSEELCLNLTFETSGSVKSMKLLGCQYFRLSDFAPQSIVSRVIALFGSDIDAEMLGQKIAWATSFSDSSPYISAEAILEISSKVRRREKMIVIVEPSWAAELVAVCDYYEQN